MSAIVIIAANGQGNRADDYDQHQAVWGTIPEGVRKALTMTDNHPADEREEFSETKWWGELTDEQWTELRDAWCIEPDDCNETMGMILGPPYGTLPALAYTAEGHEWNVGGVYPVDWVDVWFLTGRPRVQHDGGEQRWVNTQS